MTGEGMVRLALVVIGLVLAGAAVASALRSRDAVARAGWSAVSGAALVCAGVTVLIVVAGCGVPVPSFPSSSASTAVGPTPARVPADPPAGSAAEVLASLQVRRDVEVPGYRRSLFGRAWADTDSDGCNQRDQVLARDMFVAERRPGCAVIRAQFRDPYTGQFVTFLRGNGAVEIDHVVALEDAWRSGASTWPADARLAFATDTRGLQATSEAANAGKGSRAADVWLPPSPGFRCRYVALQVDVKSRWHLTVTAAEFAAMGRVLGSCPNEPMPEPAR